METSIFAFLVEHWTVWFFFLWVKVINFILSPKKRMKKNIVIAFTAAFNPNFITDFLPNFHFQDIFFFISLCTYYSRIFRLLCNSTLLYTGTQTHEFFANYDFPISISCIYIFFAVVLFCKLSCSFDSS